MAAQCPLCPRGTCVTNGLQHVEGRHGYLPEGDAANLKEYLATRRV